MLSEEKEEQNGSKKQTRHTEGSRKKLKSFDLHKKVNRCISYKQDPYYKFKEMKMERNTEHLEFQPVYFLRTHSKNCDPADVQTQIWQCAFEPDTDGTGYTSIVATCGGTSVCFINVNTGDVVLKYNRNTKVAATENLYAMAWSSLSLDGVGLETMNILAAAGGRSTVILMHPEAGCCYQMFRTVPSKTVAVVCSLLFHPKKATWLFCGHEDGHIQLWDIGVPPFPNYDVTPVHLSTIPAVAGDVYNIVFSQKHDMLIAGCESGLFAWNIDYEKIENNLRLERTEFKVPDVNDAGTLVDSICLIRDDILAIKCVLHGFIYIFRLSTALKSSNYNSEVSQEEVVIKSSNLMKLKWSDTDNYYMNMGVDTKSGLLVCGDDKGTLWVYDLFSYISGEVKSPLNGDVPLKDAIQPSVYLHWPDLDDAEVEKARKLRLDTYDIVIDKCTVSEDGNRIIAVTSNNMVCIWHRGAKKEGKQGASPPSNDSDSSD